ncbi:MAG: hypothetical protein AB1586_01700 [Pseudomonadota bacterium]
MIRGKSDEDDASIEAQMGPASVELAGEKAPNFGRLGIELIRANCASVSQKRSRFIRASSRKL